MWLHNKSGMKYMHNLSFCASVSLCMQYVVNLLINATDQAIKYLQQNLLEYDSSQDAYLKIQNVGSEAFTI